MVLQRKKKTDSKEPAIWGKNLLGITTNVFGTWLVHGYGYSDVTATVLAVFRGIGITDFKRALDNKTYGFKRIIGLIGYGFLRILGYGWFLGYWIGLLFLGF